MVYFEIKSLNMCVKELFMLMQQQKNRDVCNMFVSHILGYKMLFCVCFPLHFQTT